MNENEDDKLIGREVDAAPPAALAGLSLGRTPERDLWTAIETRILESTKVAGEIATALPALRVDRAPGRELWPLIESRIRVQRSRRLLAPWIAAAGLAASLVIVLGLLVRRGDSVTHSPLRASPEVVAAMADTGVDPALMPTAIHPLAPETRALLRANLKIVNSAETQLKRALVADPDAVYLENLLAAARQQKADLRVVLAAR